MMIKLQQHIFSFKWTRHLPLLAILLLLNACASQPELSESPDSDNANQEIRTSSNTETYDESEPIPAPEEEIEFGNFSPEILNRVIIAEMAGQRGLNQKALDDYLTIARDTNDINIIRRASRIATYMRNINAALEMAELWISKEPDSAEAHRVLAVQMVSLGRYREAMRHMETLMELGQDIDFRLITSRTSMDTDAGLFLDALIADFETLLRKYPDNQSIMLSLAQLHQQNDQPALAYNYIEDLAQDIDETPELVILEVQLLEEMGEAEQATRRLQQALRTHENHKELRFRYGRKLIEDQRYADAQEQFSIIVEQFPDDYEILYSLALLSMEVQMFSDAKRYFESLVKNAQRLDDSHYYLGYLAVEESDDAKAIEHFFNVNGGNNFLQAKRSLAELLIRNGRYKEIKAHLQNLRFRNPEYNITLLYMEANVLMDLEQYDEASLVLNNAVGAFPNNIELLLLRSVLNQDLNNLEIMEADLRRVIQINPENPIAYNSLGYTLADRTNRYEEAYELILKAAELAPDDPAIIDSLGWVQYRLGLYEEARKNLDRAYELYPDHEVASHLGEVLWVMGEKTAANRVWRKGLESQPDSKFILEAMERLTSD